MPCVHDAFVTLVLLAGVGACSAGNTSPQAPRPSPGRSGAAPVATPSLSDILTYQPFSSPVQVRIEHRDSVIVSLGDAGDQVQVTGATAFFTVGTRMIGRSGPHILEVTLDSVTTEGREADPPNDAVGVRWSSDRTEREVSQNLSPTRGGDAVDEMGHLVSLLYPILPEGGARTGSRWSETRRRVLHANPFLVRDSLAASYRADSVVTLAGMRWLHLTEEAFYTREGTVSNSTGAAIPVSGFGISSMSYYISMDGRLVRATGVDSTSMTISPPETGARIPARQISRVSITPLP